MTDKALQVLKTEIASHEIFGNLRFILHENGEIWWVAADVAKILGLKNIRQNLAELDDDEKKIINLNNSVCTVYAGGVQNGRPVWIVNEPGLYRLIFMSRKPEAKKFKRWVFHDVLPQIRKTGKYEVSDEVKEIPMEDFLEMVFKENPNADFEVTGISIEERNGKLITIYRVGLTGLND